MHSDGQRLVSTMKALLATMGDRPSITLSGTLSVTAAPSGGTVTSSTVTVSVPSGSDGVIRFTDFVMSGTVTLTYSKNGAGFVSLLEEDTVTFADGDTLALRISSASAGESLTLNLRNSLTNKIIPTFGTPTLAAS